MKLLLATDGSEDAALAARVASDLATRTASELCLVHVRQALPQGPYSGTYSEYYYRITEIEARRMLEEQVKHAKESEAKVAETYLKMGPASLIIADLAQQIDADLIVVGSRGLGPVKRIVLGSVSEGVVHHATRPTLVVRGGEAAWPPSRIVVGDDGSEDARRAGNLAARIGRLFDAPGVLVRADPEPKLPPELPEHERELFRGLREENLERERKALDHRAGELGELLGVRPEVELLADDPTAAILKAAGEDESALIAVGSRGRGAVSRTFLGSVSTKVLRAARGPVLICPRLDS
jgi:nucleotide-binding universal stress UspA family protein